MSDKNVISQKFGLIYIFMLGVGICIVLKMVSIVILDKDEAEKEVAKHVFQEREILAKKGNILAHNNRILVTSLLRYHLYYDFNSNGLSDTAFNAHVDEIAQGLSAILKDKSAKAYAAEWKKTRLDALHGKQGTRHHAVCNKEVDYIVLQQLKKLPLLGKDPNKGGLIVEENIGRVRPHNDLARRTLGSVNQVGEGFGIELAYKGEIEGKPGREVTQLISKNLRVPVSSTPKVEPVDGCDIVSTLDIDMQEIAEDAIVEKLLSAEGADLEWGSAVIMEVKTGEVRAIVNKRKAGRHTLSIVEDENYALSYSKDPGSTFKLASFLIMLEKGLNLNDSVDTKDGRIRKFGKVFEDEGSTGGMLTAQQVFERSSGVGTLELTERMYPGRKNWKDFADRIEALKLKDLAELDIQTSFPKIKELKNYEVSTLAMMATGYELEITPMQTLALYNAVANDGCMLLPRFVKEIRKDGTVVKTTQPKVVVASLCSKETLEKMKKMLEGVVENGSAKRAKSEIFKIAGKTGTAHTANDNTGYNSQLKLASFAGYFPADNPRYSCIVVFKSFSTNAKTYGGAIAAPVFKSIAEKVYAYSTDWHSPLEQTIGEGDEAPYTKSGRRGALSQALNILQIPIADKGEKREWVSTNRAGNAVSFQYRGVVSNLVPNVVNMGLQDAVFLLENEGLHVQFSGRGTVKQQTPAAGTPFEKGNSVMLALTMQ